jgi:hypothetical protein
MSTTNGGPNITTNGLVMYLDAANPKSYISGSTKWNDLSGNNNHATLVNGPTFSSSSGGVIVFDGVDDYASVSTLNLRNSNNTILIVGRYNVAATGGRILTGLNNNYLCGTWSAFVNRFYAEQWISQGGTNDTLWRIYHGSTNIGGTGTAGGTQFYSNDTGIVVGSSGGYGPNGLGIGGGGGSYNELARCDVGIVAAYNRCLTSTEILRNYSALRTRFGL